MGRFATAGRLTIGTTLAALCLYAPVAMAAADLAQKSVDGSWQRAESAHFIVYSNNGEAKTRDYVSKLEAFNTVARSFYHRIAQSEITNTNKPVFYYFAKLDQANAVTPVWKEGFSPDKSCRDGAENFWLGADDQIDDDQIEAFQFRGLNNSVFHDYDVDDMPKWLSSGLFFYLETANIKDDLIHLGKPSRYQFEYSDDNLYMNGYPEKRSLMGKNDRIPFAEIISGKYSNPKKTGSVPGQNWLVAHYMMTNSENLGKLYAYVDDYGAGMDSMAAWKKDVGIDPTFFDGLLTQYMTKGVGEVTYKVIPLKDGDVTFTLLKKSSEPVPLLSAGTQMCPTEAYAGTLLKRLKTAYDENPGDAYTQREYARAQVLLGNSAEAVPYLSAASAEKTADFDVHYLLGRAYLKQAQQGTDAQANYRHARAELGSGYQLNPTYAPLLYYYAKSFADRPDYPNDNTVTAAQTAYDLVKDSDYVMYAAELYARRGMYDDMHETLESFSMYQASRYYVVSHQIYDAVDAHKPKDEIVAMFADFTDNPYAVYKKPDAKK